MLRHEVGRLSNRLAGLCERLAQAFESAARHLRRCPQCGQSQYYGRPCQ
jgi:hypothetical protein